MNEKQWIRTHLLNKRRMMPSHEVEQKSMIIQQRLEKNQLYCSADNILYYVSYGNEVSIHRLIKNSFQTKKHVIVPCLNTQINNITPTMINSWDDLRIGAYGILEPINLSSNQVDHIDLIILPGVGFDVYGNRIGYGKGYYDRLIVHHLDVSLIGLAYEFQILERIPTNSHDKKVDEIITEKRIIFCQ